MAYIRDNPTVNKDLDIFRFICCDWYVLECMLHTKATLDTIKRRLLPLSLGVRCIHRDQNQNWQYWNDYIPLALMDFHPASKEQLELSTSMHQSTTDTDEITPAGFQGTPAVLSYCTADIICDYPTVDTCTST